MKKGIFCIRDLVGDEVIALGMSPTAGAFIRQNIPYFAKINPNYMVDYRILLIGEFTESDLKITPCEPQLISWDCYKTPEIDGGKFSVNAPLVGNIDQK